MADKNIYPNSVLVIAASGYLGLEVSKAFRKAGYVVYGLIRNEARSSLLVSNEIIPVIGDADKPSGFTEYLRQVAIIVDCSTTFLLPSNNEVQPLSLIKAAEEANKDRDPLQTPKIYLYTSGIMMYNSDKRVRDETWPLANNHYVSWRRKVEEAIINSKILHGVVLRPGWVFGGTGGPYAQLYFEKQEKIVFYGKNHDRRYSWVHVSDLADAYVLAARKIGASRGRVFNIVNGYDNPTEVEIFEKGAKLIGSSASIEWKEGTVWQHETMDATVILQSNLARDILGWSPKIFGFVDNIEFYYQSYKANKAIQEKLSN